ncbi:hypothetical protein PVL30_002505 [Lodderomyces elongisporus]|uniref:uncharacterized protein n=1 Tax=Lodderomyces elongisporus TaxID=36914 RepID=UPI0029244D0E|nr:uncharacterized protein PVL30_002505 [Lodderomyces elongisporus]WLF78762.1 hypothetical protein PVL30_002505 [Lodderomyces elongisporus]
MVLSKWLETKVFRKPSKAGKVRRINIATEPVSAQDKKKGSENKMRIDNTPKNVARHTKQIIKNLAANVIRNEYIVTTSGRARKAQPKIERLLANAMHQIKTNKFVPSLHREHSAGEPVPKAWDTVSALRFLQIPDQEECGNKVINELAQRYSNRTHGFTRVIKLEPRLGEDKAPMSVIELVDSKYEIKFWFTAKAVAKMELQNIPLDDITELNVKKLTERRPGGEEAFRDAVETCKREFFKQGAEGEEKQEVDEKVKRSLESLPYMERHTGSLKGKLLVSKKYPTRPRPQSKEAKEAVIPPSPFIKPT